MKKYFILFAAVALMAMTACNEKPAKNENGDQQNAPATEQVDTAQAKGEPKVDVEKAKPTEDGKDHTVAEFNTKEYQVKLENLADGTFRLSLWKPGQDKSGKPEQSIETKKCVKSGDGYLMQDDNGKSYIIVSNPGKEQITIMSDKELVYHGEAGK